MQVRRQFKSKNYFVRPLPSGRDGTPRAQQLRSSRNDLCPIRGVCVPLLTAFTPTGRLDLSKFKRHAWHLIGRGIRSFVPGGTTGEGQYLSVDEKISLVDALVEIREQIRKKNIHRHM